jgi:hypothetical protein
VERTHGIVINGIVHHFKKIGVAIKTDQQVLILEAFLVQFSIVSLHPGLKGTVADVVDAAKLPQLHARASPVEFDEHFLLQRVQYVAHAKLLPENWAQRSNAASITPNTTIIQGWNSGAPCLRIL